MKKIYWLVESNGDLKVTVSDIMEAQTLIEVDFKENGGGYDIEDCQYSIKPVMLTEEEYKALPDRQK